MRTRALILGVVTFVMACGYGSCYVQPDPIQLAKRFAELEALAKDGSYEARQKLLSTCSSKNEKMQVRRLACRLVSRIALPEDLGQLQKVDTSDPLWPSKQLAEIRIAARGNEESKATNADRLRNFLTDLSSAVSSESGEAQVMKGIQRHIAMQEIGFHIADQGLSLDGFPSEVVDNSPEVALSQLRSEYASVQNTEERATQIGQDLTAESTYVREAAVVLLTELGQSALPTVEDILQNNTPSSNPPPFEPNTRAFSACLDILAGIGGDRARMILKQHSESSLSYVAKNAQVRLRWVEAGVKYPARYQRLFKNPSVEE